MSQGIRLRRLGPLALLVAGLALVAATACAAPALAAPAWLPPTAISGATGAAQEPQVAVDGDGDAVAVWERVGATHFVVEAASRPAGGAWGPAVVISPPNQDSYEPQVAMNAAGDAVAAWSGYDGTNFFAESASRTPGGTWRPPVALSGAAEDDLYPAVAIDPSGAAVAVWTLEAGVENTVQAANMNPAGAWSKSVDVSDHARAQEPDAGIAANGEAVAVWVHEDAGTEFRVQSAARPAGGAWTKPVDLSNKGESSEFPSVAVDPAGDAVAVWEMQGTKGIGAADRPAGGGWRPAVEVSSGEEGFLPLVAIGPAGLTAATWERPNGPGNYTVRGATGAVGAPWGKPADVSAPGTVANQGVAVEADGTAVAVFRAPGTTKFVIQAARKPPGSTWLPPFTISTAGSDSEAAQVEAIPGGGALAVWSRVDAPNKIVETAAYDNRGPLLRSLAIPAGGVAGQLTAFSVSPFDAWAALGGVSWSFGDGGSGSGTSVGHVYSAPGTYTVTVIAADALGNATSASGRVEIAAPAFAGRAQSKRTLLVKNGKVLLPLSCPAGTLPCTGAARILATVRPGHTAHASAARRKPRKATIAGAAFDVAAGATRTVRLPLTRKGRRWLAAAGHKGLKAQLGGSGLVGRAVVLRAAHHGRKHHGH